MSSHAGATPPEPEPEPQGAGTPPEPRRRTATDPRLRELGLLFLKIGTIGFGGPAAHIAMMHDEVARRRAWIGEQEFLDLVGVNELLILATGAAVVMLVRARPAWPGHTCMLLPLLLAGQGDAAAHDGRLGRLLLTFLKIGSVLYGSGYVLLAFLRGDFVERLGWLTQSQLLDAVSIGQLTPRAAVHHRDLRGLRGGGVPWHGPGDRRDLPAVVRVRRPADPRGRAHPRP